MGSAIANSVEACMFLKEPISQIIFIPVFIQQICSECLHALARHVLGPGGRASSKTHKIAAPTGCPLDGEMDSFAHVNANSAALQTRMDAEQGVVKGETGAG